MDGPAGANSSSDFVSSKDEVMLPMGRPADNLVGAQAVQVSRWHALLAHAIQLTHSCRMLESPQDESIVRWGNEGDSFVVLEVGCGLSRVQNGRLTQ